MPKFGTDIAPTAAEVWEATARTLTDISIEEIFDLPELTTRYPRTSVNTSGTANTFGAWGQISADVGTGKRLLGCLIGMASGVANVSLEIEFGVGASGSEVAITRLTLPHYTSTYSIQGWIPLYRAITDGARLSVRAKDTASATLAVGVAVMVD